MLGGSIVEPNYTAWIVFAGTVLGMALILGLYLSRSRPGRIWRAIARDERLATAFGIRTTKYRFLVLAYGGGLAGVAGFMLARYTQFLSPEAFGMALALQLILMVFLGGRGSVWGAIVGSAIVYGVNRYFSDRGDYGDIVLGGVFIAVLVVMPLGIAGGVRQLIRGVRSGPRRGGGAVTAEAPLLEVEAASKSYRGVGGRARRRADDDCRHDPRADRSERRRQDDPPQLGVGLRDA